MELSLAASKQPTQIVVVEDHAQTRKHLIDWLNRYPTLFEVVGEAEDAYQGLEICLKTKPEILILDWHLPGEWDGSVVLRLLRGKAIMIKVLVLTSDNIVEQIAYQLGATKFLLKGCSNELLLATLLSLTID
jgi:DNA-binding NarL/FixJ family response regulator